MRAADPNAKSWPNTMPATPITMNTTPAPRSWGLRTLNNSPLRSASCVAVGGTVEHKVMMVHAAGPEWAIAPQGEMMQQLEGKTALVTGAASGIGLGMARSFARAGMAVVLCDIRHDRLDAALAEVRGLGGRAVAVVTDVSDRASVRAAGEA